MKKMSSNDIMISMAQDIIANCNWCSCFEEEEDDYGHTYITNVCPFLDRTEDPWTARCLIGDPSTWRLE